MDLWCITGEEEFGEQRIILPIEVQFESFDLYISGTEKEEHFQGIKENIENAKQISVKNMDSVSDLSKIAHSLHQNIERIKDSSNYFIGEKAEKIFVGPVLRVIGRSSIATISKNKVVFFDNIPIGSEKTYIEQQFNKIAIGTDGTDGTDEKSMIIVVARNGCIVVKPGALLICDKPLVVVKSTGDYFTISGGQANYLKVKPGIHLAFLVKLGNPVPVLFLRKPQQQVREVEAIECLKKPKVEPLVQIEVNLETEKEKSIQKSLELEVKPKSEESIKSLKIETKVETLTEVKVETLLVNDLSDNRFVPKYIFDWIRDKGYEVESGGGTALLAVGENAVVRRGKRISDSTPIAAKIIVSETDEINRRHSKPPKELSISASVEDRNVIKTFDVFSVISNLANGKNRMHSFVVMELTSGDTLYKIVKRDGKFSEDRARHVFRQVMAGVAYLHSRNIAHLNLKLNNCLVIDNKDVIKLCDFNRAENILSKTGDSSWEQKGFLSSYTPPELFNKGSLDLLKVDLWMCGCILFSLLTGNLTPFGEFDQTDQINVSDNFKAFQNRQNTGIVNNINVSEMAANILSLMLKTNPIERPDVRLLLDHNWLK